MHPHDKPWMTGEIRRAQCKRDRLHSRAKNINSPEAWARYREQRNIILNRLINKAKKQHTKSVIDKINSLDRSGADWWKVVRTALGSSRDNYPCASIRRSGRHFFATDDLSKANLLNDFLSV